MQYSSQDRKARPGVWCAAAVLQRQAQSHEARALSAEQAAAALQQDVANWQGRYKKKDAELAGHASKVFSYFKLLVKWSWLAPQPL